MTITSNRREFLKQFGTAGVISLAANPSRFLARAADVAATTTTTVIAIIVLMKKLMLPVHLWILMTMVCR